MQINLATWPLRPTNLNPMMAHHSATEETKSIANVVAFMCLCSKTGRPFSQSFAPSLFCLLPAALLARPDYFQLGLPPLLSPENLDVNSSGQAASVYHFLPSFAPLLHSRGPLLSIRCVLLRLFWSPREKR